jgi:hypothetical protein
VALFECKHSRPDLNRDSAQTKSIEIELRALQERRQNLERLLAVHYPHLRIPSSLFPEWDPFDPERLPHSGYQRLIRRILALQRKLEGNTKFERVTRYRLANLHFLVAPSGLVRTERVPPGWGLLEAPDNERLELLIQPRFYPIANGFDWLERICKNTTIRWLKTTGAIVVEENGAAQVEKVFRPEGAQEHSPGLGQKYKRALKGHPITANGERITSGVSKLSALQRPGCHAPLELPAARHGSNPARITSETWHTPGAPEIFAPPRHGLRAPPSSF